MSERVDAVTARAPRSGLTLLAAAPTIDDPELRWIDGFKWAPELTTAGSAIGLECGGTDDRDPSDQPAIQEFPAPYLVWAADKCNTKGWQTRDPFGRARRALEAEQSFLVDRELWNAAAAGVAAGNAHLAASTADLLTTSGVSVGVGITWIDSALTRALRNRQGMVHMRPEIQTIAAANELIWRDGLSWFTPNGHIVVADAGATGDGPRSTALGAVRAANGSRQYIYGTDVISTRLGPVETLPSSDGLVSEGIDRETNTLTVFAQRPAAVQWDRLAHIAVELAQGKLV